MIEQILKWLWQVSLQASILIIALLMIRLLFKGKISARLRYTLWVLALVRLLIPITISSPISMMNSTQIITQTVERIFIEKDTTLPVQASNNSDQYHTSINQATGNDSIMPSTSHIPTATILLTLWLAGAVVVFLLTIISNVRFGLSCKQVRERVNVDDILQPLIRQLGLRKPPIVYECSAVTSACVVGFINPCIYLPNVQLTETQYRHILLHELCHIRRHDNHWSVIRGVCCILYWFNPLIWLAGYFAHRDCELACDEQVMAKLDDSERQAYGMTLVSQLKKGSSSFSTMNVTATLTMGKKEMKERIKMIAKHKKPALRDAIFALLLVMSVMVVACTNASSLPRSKTINEVAPANMQNYHTPDSQTTKVSESPTVAVNEFELLPDTMSFNINAKGLSESTILKKFIFNNLLVLYLDANALEYVTPADESNCGSAVLKEGYQLGEDSPSPEISIQFRQDGDVRKWVRATQTIADPGKYTEVTIGGYHCTKMTEAIMGVNYERYAIDHLNGYLLIQLKYFDEYAEGWADQMRQMLNTIILNEDI